MGILKKHIKKKPKKRTAKNKKTLPRSSNFLAKRSKKKLKKNSKNKTKQKKPQTKTSPKKPYKPKIKKKTKKRKHHPAFTPLKMAEVHNLTKIITSLYSDEKNDKYPKTNKFSDKTTPTKIYISSHFYIIYM